MLRVYLCHSGLFQIFWLCWVLFFLLLRFFPTRSVHPGFLLPLAERAARYYSIRGPYHIVSVCVCVYACLKSVTPYSGRPRAGVSNAWLIVCEPYTRKPPCMHDNNLNSVLNRFFFCMSLKGSHTPIETKQDCLFSIEQLLGRRNTVSYGGVPPSDDR